MWLQYIKYCLQAIGLYLIMVWWQCDVMFCGIHLLAGKDQQIYLVLASFTSMLHWVSLSGALMNEFVASFYEGHLRIWIFQGPCFGNNFMISFSGFTAMWNWLCVVGHPGASANWWVTRSKVMRCDHTSECIPIVYFYWSRFWQYLFAMVNFHAFSVHSYLMSSSIWCSLLVH